MGWIESCLVNLWDAVRTALFKRRISILLLTILLIDSVLVGLFLWWAKVEHDQVKGSFFYGKHIFSVEDQGLIESFGYLKEAAVCTLLAACYQVSRRPIYLFLLLLLALLLLDDSLAVHEAMGTWLRHHGSPAWMSEGPGAAILGLLSVPLVVYAWWRGEAPDRSNVEAIVLALLPLLFFGVAVDAVHGKLKEMGYHSETISSLVEDGGELLSLTILLLVAVGVYLRVLGARKIGLYSRGSVRQALN